MAQTEFEYYFARSWFHSINKVFSYILTITILITFFVVIYLANRDYESLKAELHSELESRFQQQMIRLLSESTFTEPVPEPTPSKETELNRKTDAEETIDIYEKAFKSKGGTGKDVYGDLPLTDLSDIEIDVSGLDNIKVAPRAHFSEKTGRTSSAYVQNPEDDLMHDPYTYKIYRDANIYLDVPDYYVQASEDYGYRDQNEIMKVIYTKSSIIESCYEKAARMVSVNRGYVKVEFQISYDGYVLPESIKIISSTIRNRSVEQCIKKTISRWRDFAKLDETMGIAHVVHKFVFN